MAAYNSLNITSAGLVRFDGTNVFTGVTTTNHDVLVGAASNGITSVSPSTSGFVLTSNGVSADPSFQTVSASGAITTITGDSGSATPTAGAVTIFSNTAAQGAGSSVSFTNSGSTSTLVVTTSAPSNTIMGGTAGNATISGTLNTGFGQLNLRLLSSGNSNGAFGHNALSKLTTGSDNTAIGRVGLPNLLTGDQNSTLGRAAGTNYTSSETGNIVLGAYNLGTTGESYTLRIGSATGASQGNLQAAFICGINGVTTSNSQIVTINSSTNQLGTTVTPTVTSITFGAGSALSNYVASTTWTPVLSFGGASVGITYSTQTGSYSRIGSIVTFRATIVLTSKGSSTGAMSISGIPLNPSAFTPVTLRVATGITSATASYFQAAMGSGGGIIIESVICLTGATATLDNTNFSNSPEIEFSGSYLV